mmetsp:Transcript_41844/g.48347  ORF Transcript_41844/g.48347 Transcript_41844/m.48347 type:complete len:103 (+) Transcript_41844:2911-3219(+)
MQIFNMINARKINDELNIFKGMLENKTFLLIIGIISIIQFILVQFTRDVFEVARDGLAWHQWLFCIAVGLTVFPVRLIAKFLPDKCFPKLGKKKKIIEPISE